MYKRFLNNEDYARLLPKGKLEELSRGSTEAIEQAEEDAEASIIEYLTDNYEVEKELYIGKSLIPYNSSITYPVHAHFYYQDKIYEAIRPINGHKAPSSINYWTELIEYDKEKYDSANPYSQIKSYAPGDVVTFANAYFQCIEYNGLDFDDIRVPGINAWKEKEVYPWQPNLPYNAWDVVSFEGKFYALTNPEDLDLTVNPFKSENWGMIGDYRPDYTYELKETEYVVYDDKVYMPSANPNADKLEEGFNIRQHDPRNSNIKKHMARLAVYELFKLISPNNVSSSRITDYEMSLQWLKDANRCRISPNIPRKLDKNNQPLTEFAMATYRRSFDPYKNEWII